MVSLVTPNARYANANASIGRFAASGNVVKNCMLKSLYLASGKLEIVLSLEEGNRLALF